MALSLVGQNPMLGLYGGGLSGNILGQRTFGDPFSSMGFGSNIFGGFDPTTSQLAMQFGGGCGFGGGMMNPMMGMGAMGMYGMMDPTSLTMMMNSMRQYQRQMRQMTLEDRRENAKYDLQSYAEDKKAERGKSVIDSRIASRDEVVTKSMLKLKRQIHRNEQDKVMPAFEEAITAIQNRYFPEVDGIGSSDADRRTQAIGKLMAMYPNIEIDLLQYGSSSFAHGLKRVASFGLSNKRTCHENVRDIIGDDQVDKGVQIQETLGKAVGFGTLASIGAGVLAALITKGKIKPTAITALATGAVATAGVAVSNLALNNN